MNRLFLCAVLVSAGVVGCTSETGPQEEPSATQETTTTTQTTQVTLDDITVSGNVGEEATVSLGGTLPADAAGFRRVVAGSGPPAAQGSVVRIQYSIYDITTGAKRGSTYDKDPSYVVLTEGVTDKTFVDGLTGAKTGSRTAFVRSPVASETTNADAGPRLVVVDVLKIIRPRATGKAVKPPKTLPKVTLAKSGAPSIKKSSAKAPKKLLVQPLIKGTGPKVRANQKVTVMYRGVKWNDGKQVDSTWQDMLPKDFPLGQGKVIKGWDVGLIGQSIGSQVMLVVPPSHGYGKEGNESAGIKGTDTLVYVVDILDAY